MLKPRKT